MNTLKTIATALAIIAILYVIWKLKVIIIAFAITVVLVEMAYHAAGKETKLYRRFEKMCQE